MSKFKNISEENLRENEAKSYTLFNVIVHCYIFLHIKLIICIECLLDVVTFQMKNVNIEFI